MSPHAALTQTALRDGHAAQQQDMAPRVVVSPDRRDVHGQTSPNARGVLPRSRSTLGLPFRPQAYLSD